MERLELAIPTLFGLEGLCADELRRLELPGVRAENGRVRCQAAPGDIPRVNLNLRTGERVLLVAGEYEARDFDALFEGCRALFYDGYAARGEAVTACYRIPDGVLEEALDWIRDNGIPLETWNTYSFLY